MPNVTISREADLKLWNASKDLLDFAEAFEAYFHGVQRLENDEFTDLARLSKLYLRCRRILQSVDKGSRKHSFCRH